MNNVVKIWDVYDNSAPTVIVVHPREEVRLQNEVERLNSTIAALEAERDEHLRTIADLKQAKAVPVSKMYCVTRKKVGTTNDKSELARYKKLYRDEVRITNKWVDAIYLMRGRIAREGVAMLKSVNFDTENQSGKLGVRLIGLSEELLEMMDGKKDGEK